MRSPSVLRQVQRQAGSSHLRTDVRGSILRPRRVGRLMRRVRATSRLRRIVKCPAAQCGKNLKQIRGSAPFPPSNQQIQLARRHWLARGFAVPALLAHSERFSKRLRFNSCESWGEVMKVNRRELLRSTALASGAALLGVHWYSDKTSYAQQASLPSLPSPDKSGIERRADGPVGR